MQLQGARVVVHDPEAIRNARRLFPTLGYAARSGGRLRGADLLVLHLTEWRLYREADPAALAAVVPRRRSWTPATCWRSALAQRRLDPAGTRPAQHLTARSDARAAAAAAQPPSAREISSPRCMVPVLRKIAVRWSCTVS